MYNTFWDVVMSQMFLVNRKYQNLNKHRYLSSVNSSITSSQCLKSVAILSSVDSMKFA